MLEPLRKWRPHVSLGHLLLLVTAVAIAIAYVRVQAELAQTKTALQSMRELVRELVVDDPSKIAAITRIPTLPGEHILDVYIPNRNGSEMGFHLCLAVEDVVLHGNAEQRFPSPLNRHPIPPGRHTVEIRHDKADSSDSKSQHRIVVLLDEKAILNATRPNAWMAVNGWTSTGTITETQTFDSDKPAELHRRRFNQPKKGGGSSSGPLDTPAHGILVWIE